MLEFWNWATCCTSVLGVEENFMESLSTFLLSLSTAQNQGKDVDVGNDDTNAVVDVSVR